MHSIKSSNNKLLSIFGLISTPKTITNEISYLLIVLNNTNASGNSKKKTIIVNFVIKNEEVRELNRDKKVGLEVQSNIAIMTLISY